jgi:DNA-binding transcriptional ArsR family regulator
MRLRILSALRERPLAVCDLSTRLEARQYKVSRHLGALHDLGLVRRARVGQRVLYSLSERVQPHDGDAANVELGCCCVRLE